MVVFTLGLYGVSSLNGWQNFSFFLLFLTGIIVLCNQHYPAYWDKLIYRKGAWTLMYEDKDVIIDSFSLVFSSKWWKLFLLKQEGRRIYLPIFYDQLSSKDWHALMLIICLNIF